MYKVFFCALASLFIISCQKEVSTPDPLPAPTLLIRSVEKTGSDSVVTEYTYDANKRLVGKKQSGFLAGSNKYNEMWITRNGNGAITKTIEKAAYLTASGTDSVVTRFNYNTSSSQYVYSIMETAMPGITIYDSVVYNYDGAGRIIRDNHFQKVTGVPFTQIFKQEYVYTSAGNIDSVNNYNYNSGPGTYMLASVVSYVYDIKVNPLRLANESIILYLFHFFGLNNATEQKAVFISSPSANNFSVTTFVYNTENRPVSSATTKTPGSPSTTVFYYQ